MTADSTATSAGLERYRPYLLTLARLQWGRSLRGKVDPSDIVQQTLVKAQQACDAQREFGAEAAWLRQILARVMIDHLRQLHAQKRDVRREQSLEEALGRSSNRLQAWLAGSGSTPSQRAARQDELLRLTEALEHLSADQREVIELHHLQGLTILEVAQTLDCSRAAVAGLLRRGLKKLRRKLGAAGGGP